MGALVIAPFLPAIMWASVLAVLTFPLYKKLVERPRFARLKWGPVAASLIVTLGTLMLLILPVIAFGTIAALEVGKALQSKEIQEQTKHGGFTLAGVAKEVDKLAEPIMTQIPVPAVQEFRLAKFLEDNGSQLAEAVQGPAAAGLKRFAMALFSAIVTMLTLFFMLKDGNRLLAPTLAIIPLPRDEAMKVLIRLRETVWSVFMGVVFVAMIQAALAGIAFGFLKVPGAIIWTLATFLCAMIPLVGPPVVFVPLSVVLLVQGRTGEAIFLILYGSLVLSQVDNLLRPFFIGARSSLHPMSVFFSLLGGALLMGPIGLMAGPIILTLCIIVAEIVITRRQLMESERPAALEETAEGVGA